MMPRLLLSLCLFALLAPQAVWACAGCATGGSALDSAVLLTAPAPEKSRTTAVSRGFIESFVLQLALQQDPELQHIRRQQGLTNTLTLGTVVAVSGLGLAQSITSLNDVQASNAHHDEDHHFHSSTAPAVLGIIGSSVSLGSMGLRSVMLYRLNKQAKARQQVIETTLHQFFQELHVPVNPSQASTKITQLAAFIGPDASAEAMTLWRLLHP